MARAASPLLSNARALAARGGAVYMWIIPIKSLTSVPERGQDCLLYRVLQGVERHPMEPHRAPLGGEGHSTEAHESFHGDDPTVGVHY